MSIELTKYSDYLVATAPQKTAIMTTLRAKTDAVRMMYMTRSEFIAGGKDLKGSQVCVVPDGQTEAQTKTLMESTAWLKTEMVEEIAKEQAKEVVVI